MRTFRLIVIVLAICGWLLGCESGEESTDTEPSDTHALTYTISTAAEKLVVSRITQLGEGPEEIAMIGLAAVSSVNPVPAPHWMHTVEIDNVSTGQQQAFKTSSDGQFSGRIGAAANQQVKVTFVLQDPDTGQQWRSEPLDLTAQEQTEDTPKSPVKAGREEARVLGAIEVTPPDSDGLVTVAGPADAVDPEVVVFLSNSRTSESTTEVSGPAGDFKLQIAAQVGDILFVMTHTQDNPNDTSGFAAAEVPAE